MWVLSFFLFIYSTPGNYPPNRDCEWDLSASIGKRIQFQFFTMQLEAHETCQYDYVEVSSISKRHLGCQEFSPLFTLTVLLSFVNHLDVQAARGKQR